MLALDWTLSLTSCAITLVVVLIRHRRRPGGWAAGLTPEECRTVRRAVDRGAALRDPPLRDAASALARTRIAGLKSRGFKPRTGLMCVPMAVFWGAATNATESAHTPVRLAGDLVGGAIFAVALLAFTRTGRLGNARRAHRLNAIE